MEPQEELLEEHPRRAEQPEVELLREARAVAPLPHLAPARNPPAVDLLQQVELREALQQVELQEAPQQVGLREAPQQVAPVQRGARRVVRRPPHRTRM